jgi:hypothetical protein
LAKVDNTECLWIPRLESSSDIVLLVLIFRKENFYSLKGPILNGYFSYSLMIGVKILDFSS